MVFNCFTTANQAALPHNFINIVLSSTPLIQPTRITSLPYQNRFIFNSVYPTNPHHLITLSTSFYLQIRLSNQPASHLYLINIVLSSTPFPQTSCLTSLDDQMRKLLPLTPFIIICCRFPSSSPLDMTVRYIYCIINVNVGAKTPHCILCFSKGFSRIEAYLSGLICRITFELSPLCSASRGSNISSISCLFPALLRGLVRFCYSKPCLRFASNENLARMLASVPS